MATRYLDLQGIFNSVLAGDTVSVLFKDKQAYDSFRTSILRKYREYKRLLDKLGADDPYEGKYLQARFDREEVKGEFKLASDGDKQNKEKSYIVQDL